MDNNLNTTFLNKVNESYSKGISNVKGDIAKIVDKIRENAHPDRDEYINTVNNERKEVEKSGDFER